MASQPVQAAPARVCPHCSAIGQVHGPRCPWCSKAYRRPSPLPAVAAMLLVTAVIVLGGVAAMLVAAGSTLNDTLDTQVTRVQRDIGGQFDDVTRQVRDELDARLPAQP